MVDRPTEEIHETSMSIGQTLDVVSFEVRNPGQARGFIR